MGGSEIRYQVPYKAVCAIPSSSDKAMKPEDIPPGQEPSSITRVNTEKAIAQSE
jgi:hypothetical protein